MEQLLEWLAAGGCGEEDARGVEALIEEFPYFPAPRLLCLKRTYDLDRDAFPEKLRQHAAHVPNSRQFYRYLQQLPPFEAKAMDRDGEGYTFELIREKARVPSLAVSPVYRLEDEFPDDDTRDASTEDAIDIFIRREPVMPKISPETEFTETPQREDDEELFSETLAKIYTRQKLYDKAIATYRKLSLKYPEKSIYFARLIEKTDELKKI
ncbi:MAG: hypothetical protein LBI96_04010 [Odoribacteraceae bacterium]|jgi:hypothetical protein|nr:hypothetical protein [Odoribacteraceae bacterium]